VRNVQVQGVGHISLPIDGRVVREICTTLAHLDHDGSETTPAAEVHVLPKDRPGRTPGAQVGR
jgi:hypothetical protein